VAVVSSGDPGVFGMAATVLEAVAGRSGADGPDVEVRVVPGVTAAHAAAGALGAPLAGAHAVVSLSDLLVPWSTIEGQLRAAASAGLPIALYNPRSKGRPDHLDRARQALSDLLAPDTPCAVVTAAGTAEQSASVATLATLDPSSAGMRSVVLVGTADTTVVGDRLLTHRHHPARPTGVER
jgi:precorrin-3B C17-methyltransferase